MGPLSLHCSVEWLRPAERSIHDPLGSMMLEGLQILKVHQSEQEVWNLLHTQKLAAVHAVVDGILAVVHLFVGIEILFAELVLRERERSADGLGERVAKGQVLVGQVVVLASQAQVLGRPPGQILQQQARVLVESEFLLSREELTTPCWQ